MTRIMKDAATGQTVCGHHREAAMRRLGIPLADEQIEWLEPAVPTEDAAAPMIHGRPDDT